jgi:hypothetical protein
VVRLELSFPPCLKFWIRKQHWRSWMNDVWSSGVEYGKWSEEVGICKELADGRVVFRCVGDDEKQAT